MSTRNQLGSASDDPDLPETFAESLDHWDHPRSIAGVVLLVDHAVSAGTTAEECLVGTGLPVEALQDWSGIVEAQQEIAVIRNVVQQLGDKPGLGVEVGARYHLTTYGIFGYALLSCDTMADAVETGLNYISLSFAFTKMVVKIAPSGKVIGRFSASQIPQDVRRFCTERDMAASVTMHREMLADPALHSLREVRFAFPAVDDLEFRRHFHVTPQFMSAHSELVFDPDSLRLPLPQRNAHTALECIRLCEQMKVRRLSGSGVASALRARLRERDGIDQGLESAAKALFLTPRTFRRRLASEGTSYRAVINEVRRTMALDMVRVQRLSPSVVAERLGYRDMSSFLRALRRWESEGP
ncbi:MULTISPECIES: AraC family transcriptional regulator [unclassified Mycobacterium]|uniref:AraC family transcriptional regulator n=1 Tax=unclassified Mycobacterium TaxID=2642494 RepID=UPI0029C93A89|nr:MULTISPECIES: AraC family transcriptional regulator ligand-binding domain-containing protein [unclassified Mycobacterium]